LKTAYERFFKVLVLLGWPLTVGTFVLAPSIARLFRLFPQSEPALRILAIAIVFLFANSAFYAMLNAIDRQGLNAWATGLAAALNIGLNLLLIPYYGYLAASANTVATELALCVFGWWFVQYRRSHLRLQWVRHSWRILLAGAAMGALLYVMADLPIYISAPAGGIAYLLAAYALRIIEPAEWELLRTGLVARWAR
jgi:O-antigen/teichoic acid export membrane protein